MDTDDSMVPIPLAFTTVADELDDNEAESLFKELKDWVWYLAQHKGQRQQLLTLTTKIVMSLLDFLGKPGGGKTDFLCSGCCHVSTSPKKAQKGKSHSHH